MTSSLTAAVIAGGVSLLVSALSALTARRLQDAKMRTEAENLRVAQKAALDAQDARLRGEAENARRAQEADFLIQEARLRTELRTEFMAEEAIRELLTREDWRLRSFEAIKNRVRGFDDNELRRLLVRAGAVAFEQTATGAEMWGLRERHLDRL